MKAYNAIKELETFRQTNIRSLKPALSSAIKLGIEALDRIVSMRVKGLYPGAERLPSETKD